MSAASHDLWQLCSTALVSVVKKAKIKLKQEETKIYCSNKQLKYFKKCTSIQSLLREKDHVCMLLYKDTVVFFVALNKRITFSDSVD